MAQQAAAIYKLQLQSKIDALELKLYQATNSPKPRTAMNPVIAIDSPSQPITTNSVIATQLRGSDTNANDLKNQLAASQNEVDKVKTQLTVF